MSLRSRADVPGLIRRPEGYRLRRRSISELLAQNALVETVTGVEQHVEIDIPRLLDMGIRPEILAGNIIGILAQRLVRTICPHCKTTIPMTDEWAAKLKKVDIKPEQMDGQVTYGVGCEECFHSGYSGRTAIYEFMPVDEVLRTQIMEGATATQMKRSAIERGMITLRMDGQDKILRRLTTADEVLRVTQLDMG